MMHKMEVRRSSLQIGKEHVASARPPGALGVAGGLANHACSDWTLGMYSLHFEHHFETVVRNIVKMILDD